MGQSGPAWASSCLFGGCGAAPWPQGGQPVCSWATHSPFVHRIITSNTRSGSICSAWTLQFPPQTRKVPDHVSQPRRGATSTAVAAVSVRCQYASLRSIVTPCQCAAGQPLQAAAARVKGSACRRPLARSAGPTRLAAGRLPAPLAGCGASPGSPLHTGSRGIRKNDRALVIRAELLVLQLYGALEPQQPSGLTSGAHHESISKQLARARLACCCFTAARGEDTQVSQACLRRPFLSMLHNLLEICFGVTSLYERLPHSTSIRVDEMRQDGSSPVKRAVARRLTDLSALQAAPPEAASGFKLRERAPSPGSPASFQRPPGLCAPPAPSNGLSAAVASKPQALPARCRHLQHALVHRPARGAHGRAGGEGAPPRPLRRLRRTCARLPATCPKF